MNKTNGNGGDVLMTDIIDNPREPLFPDDVPDEQPTINTIDATQQIRVIRAIEKQIEQYDLQDKESRFFYAEKKRKCEEQIEYIKRSLLGFLQLHGMKNIQTPAGTAYQRTITTKTWPDDDILLTWAGIHLPYAIRNKQEPDKKLIGEHIKTTGEVPDGYSEKEEIHLYLK